MKTAETYVKKMNCFFWIILMVMVICSLPPIAMAQTGLETSQFSLAENTVKAAVVSEETNKKLLILVSVGFLVGGLLILSAILVMKQGKKKNE